MSAVDVVVVSKSEEIEIRMSVVDVVVVSDGDERSGVEQTGVKRRRADLTLSPSKALNELVIVFKRGACRHSRERVGRDLS